MTRTFYKYNGVLIRTPSGNLTDSTNCCCEIITDCCCLQQYTHVDPACDDFTCVISGAVGGTGTLTCVAAEPGYCLQWFGDVTLSLTCGDILTAHVTIKCPTGSTDPQDIEISVTWDGADCTVDTVGADPIVPDAGADCNPLDLTFTDRWETRDILPGGCACGQGVKISINIFV